ncbi:MAG: hypothetical protein WCH34_12160 [Bacteroidota bacterium]
MEDKNAPINRLEGEFQEALLKLMAMMFNLTQTEEENDEEIGEEDDEETEVAEEYRLDFQESFALLHALVQTFYYIKRHLDLPPEKKDMLEPEFIEYLEFNFYNTKDIAANLIGDLSSALYYTDYGLQTLEDVFGIKWAVRPLKVDKTKEMSTLTINEDNQHLFSWAFSILDYLEFCQDDYEFAKHLYSCQFIHIEDYKYISKKLHQCKAGDKFSFTLYDTLCLYFALSIAGRMYVSDAADIYDDIDKRIREESPPLKVTTTQIRDFFLNFNVSFLADVKNSLSQNNEFQEQIKLIEQWEL